MSPFDFQKIEQNDPRFKDILALRYRVYCEERGFESPEDHPDGLETDEYDDSSIHFAAIARKTQKVVGTIRLILNSEKIFPIEESFEFTKSLPHIERDRLGEVSRLALSRRYCRELKGGLRLGSEAGEVVSGLIHRMVYEGCQLGIHHMYAVMARGLPILLARRKIFFSKIGPAKEYHGLRTPYICTVQEVVNRNPQLFYGCQSLEPTEKAA
jgi:N-acyl amino acid synthase of PEP-CTERM/exosortase system